MGTALLAASQSLGALNKTKKRPNIFFCISDDQSWLHAGAYGDKVVKTPNFDRIAKEGVLFTHSFCSSPSCTPSRAAVLTGQEIWRLGQGSTLRGTLFKNQYKVYTSLLEEAGYLVGFTGKGWAPGNTKAGGWGNQNPVGKQFNSKAAPSSLKGIAATDYAENFKEFLNTRKEEQPFCFWFGPKEPHRDYDIGSGLKSGKKLADVRVPESLPDATETRSDILDYYMEIEWYDKHLGRMLKLLEDKDELDNTLIVVTSDNGMPFPRAKANLYDMGVHMPLAVCWGKSVKGGRVVDDFISHTDFAPTFLAAAGLEVPAEMTGRSFLDILLSKKQGRVDSQRDFACSAIERHSICRPDGMGYPMRAIRDRRWLYIRNYEHDRWPAGDPGKFGDCDDGPTKAYIIEHQNDPKVMPLFEKAFGKRSTEELYDVKNDPGQINNLADEPAFAETKKMLQQKLFQYQQKTSDPRAQGKSPWDNFKDEK
ncbi:MAG: hypothetical protein A2Y10_03810 [Planctomycetes bacterium GWF2_41_51]|nr:MAG: hypothetical protein A2Y10_03810 [Planctomycetes bacterium GWF2_41_51]